MKISYWNKFKDEYKELPRVQKIYFIFILGCIISFFIGLFTYVDVLVMIGIGGGIPFSLSYLFVEYFKKKGTKFKH